MFKISHRSNILPVAVANVAIATSTIFAPYAIDSADAAVGRYCQFTPEEIARKKLLLESSLETETIAKQEYESILQRHNDMLRECRQHSWPQEQAIWLRLYPCDASPGSIDRVLDRIVNLGYNKIHLEVFYDSQVLLPQGDNPTPWTSVISSPGGENIDLLQQTIDKAHLRGIKVYAWLFTMNFGYTYAQRADRQDALARNGMGSDSLTFVHDRSQAFVDPYNLQAQIDYQTLVSAVLKRNPDGILFDYIRYPRGSGTQSSVNSVKDLWIYGKSSLKALYNRASNKKGKAAIEKYINNGTLTVNDIATIDKKYPEEELANWQGRKRTVSDFAKTSLKSRHRDLQTDLWFFVVAHAAQGILDFLDFAAQPARDRGLSAGAVFFPDANRLVGQKGFDSRLQAWDKFDRDLEWHPMAYAICEGTDCITDQVELVLETASPQTKVIPALAGVWGGEYRQHPSLEEQMEAVRKSSPQLNSVSHFAYSWQEAKTDRQRQSCNLQ